MRVAVAQLEPKLSEKERNLDACLARLAMHARIVKDELKERSRQGMTVFLSTHTLNVAEEMADRVGIIHHGKLAALGTVDELRSQSAESGALEKVFLAIVDAEAGSTQHERAPAQIISS